MSLVRNWKFFLCLFLDILGLETVSDDHLVKNQALLDYKKSFLNSQHIDIFSKGLTHNFGQTMEILSFFVLGQKVLEIMFDDYWSRKQALLEYKKLAITKSP